VSKGQAVRIKLLGTTMRAWLNLSVEVFDAAADAFCEDDAEKRKWLLATLNTSAYPNLDKYLTAQIDIRDVVLLKKTSLSRALLAGGLASGGLQAWSRLEQGSAPMLGSQDLVLRQGRSHLLHHAGLAPGGVIVVNVYLGSGAGLNGFNIAALYDVACRLKQRGRPYVSGILRYFDGECVDTAEPTCAQSMRALDLFIVSRQMVFELETTRQRLRIRAMDLPKSFALVRLAGCA
ncbi:unnamed protein product, partial [Prorocentrum cordatum]